MNDHITISNSFISILIFQISAKPSMIILKESEVENHVSFHSSYTIMGNTMVNFMGVPKSSKDHQNFGAQPNLMKRVNIIMTFIMNIMVIVHQSVQLKMIVLGILGVLGLPVQKLVELELSKDLELFFKKLNWMARNVLMRMPLKPKNVKL